MPVASGRSGGSRQLLILAFATVVGLGAMFFLVSRAGQLTGSSRVEVNLGSETFTAGPAERTADFIDDQGPWLMPDVAGRDRDLILQHRGDDPLTGWFAFAARPKDASRDCNLVWQPAEVVFVDSCNGTVYDAEGSGLLAYPVVLDADNNVIIDVNANQRTSDDADSLDAEGSGG